MSEEFEKKLEAALRDAYMPFISGMVQVSMVHCIERYDELGEDVPVEVKEETILKSVEKMASDIRKLTGRRG